MLNSERQGGRHLPGYLPVIRKPCQPSKASPEKIEKGKRDETTTGNRKAQNAVKSGGPIRAFLGGDPWRQMCQLQISTPAPAVHHLFSVLTLISEGFRG